MFVFIHGIISEFTMDSNIFVGHGYRLVFHLLAYLSRLSFVTCVYYRFRLIYL